MTKLKRNSYQFYLTYHQVDLFVDSCFEIVKSHALAENAKEKNPSELAVRSMYTFQKFSNSNRLELKIFIEGVCHFNEETHKTPYDATINSAL